MKIHNLTNVKSLFLDNITIKQTIFKNTFWLGLGSGLGKLLTLILTIYFARIFGATEYGKFTFALAFISLFLVFSDLGLSGIVIREFSREKEKEKEFYSVLSLKILLNLVTIVLILIGSFFITPDLVVRKVILILGFYILISGFSTIIYDFFKARQRMEYQALGTILEAVLVTIFGFFIIFNFPSIENLSYGYLSGGLITLAFVLFLFHFKIFPLKIFWEKNVWKKFLSMSWPLALTSLYGSLYFNINSAIMGHFGQIIQTGWYNAAYKIASAVLTLIAFISIAFFPALSKYFQESKEKFQSIWNYELNVIVLLAFPLVAGGITLAPNIINFVYGQGFSPSILAFKILIAAIGIIFLFIPFKDILIVANRQVKIFLVILFGLIVNIILNSVLIPKYSLYGAVAGTLITYFLVLVISICLIKNIIDLPFFNRQFLKVILVSLFCSALMVFVISRPIISQLNVLLMALLGAGVYFMSLLLLNKKVKII